MTIESPYTIDTSEIQDGRAPGSIVPGSIRIIVDSLAGMPFSTNSPKVVSYTATIQDRGANVDFNSATAVLYTIPPNSSVAFDVGTLLICTQIGAGMVSFTQGSGVTFTGSIAKTFNTAQKYSIIFARKTATDTWNIFGDLMGQFYVNGGQIISPTGAPFVPRGINIADWGAINASGGSGGTNNGALLPTLFPGINFVRLNCQGTAPLTQTNGNDDPAQFATFIANCTANKIVVLVEDHNTAKTVLTGGALTTETAWYVSWANAYGSNPYVWFGTMNEPQAAVGNQALITTQQVATYNGIRGAGCSNMILMELIGGYTTDQGGGGGSLTAASYTTMTNVGWDFHYYNWLATAGATPYTTSYSLLASTLAAAVKSTQAFTTSANGVMPLLFGEFGNSTAGAAADPGGTQTILAVQASGYGGAAWTWFAGVSDRITDGASNLTVYGLEVAAWIAGADVMGPVLGTTPWATTSLNPLNAVHGTNFDLTLTGPAVSAFTLGYYQQLSVFARNQTNSAEFATSFMVMVSREGSGATITQSAAFGVIGTGGTIAFGSGTLNLSWQSVAADGSAFTLRITNSSADTYSVWVNLNTPNLGP